MTFLQKFFMAVLPRRWAESAQAESRRWLIRCCACGATSSVWDNGGIRWKAASAGKRMVVKCSHCGQLRAASVELAPPEPPEPPATEPPSSRRGAPPDSAPEQEDK